MLGMMQGKGGGSTNMPAAPNVGMPAPGAAPGGMPGKGGGAMTQAAPGLGGGAGLASLFMGNAPTGAAQPPQMLPTITQPRGPIIDPPQRRPLPVPLPQPAAPMPHFKNINEVMTFNTRNPGKLTPDVLTQYKRMFQTGGGNRR